MRARMLPIAQEIAIASAVIGQRSSGFRNARASSANSPMQMATDTIGMAGAQRLEGRKQTTPFSATTTMVPMPRMMNPIR